MLGFVLFNLLLPSSVIDPLMKDYIEKHTLELMNANLLDNLFVLAFVTMQLNGDVTKCEDSVMEEMHALYSAVVQRNCAAMELLQDGDFKRACSSSFEQLYCVLYSYGSTILSLERLRGLVTRALSHMENSLLASEVGEVTSLVSALWEKMKESAFVIKAGSDEGRTSGDMEALKKEGKYTGSFNSLCHFFGYEGRCGLPSCFDTNYCYALGYNAGILIHEGLNGMMSTISNLDQPVEAWTAGGVPITMMMNIERRAGKDEPVIKKALVELDGLPYQRFLEQSQEWKLNDCYSFPGPIQFTGPAANIVNQTLLYDIEARKARLGH